MGEKIVAFIHYPSFHEHEISSDDPPQTIMNLQSQQVAYQSALGASAKILQTSLVDFLK